MKRDLRRAVKEYRRKLDDPSNIHHKGEFYVSDVMQIKQMAEEEAAGRGGKEVLYNAVYIALAAGYEVGRRTAVRDLKQ